MIKVEVLEGEAILVEHINYMYEFYLSTSEKKWGRPYLSKDFFPLSIKLCAISWCFFLLMLMEIVSQEQSILKMAKAYMGGYWGCKGSFGVCILSYATINDRICYQERN